MKNKKLLGIDMKCTHYIFGDFRINQAVYDCRKCNLKEICKFCFEMCHKKCDPVSTSKFTEKRKFVCSCATRLDHNIEKEDRNLFFMNCNLRTHDKKIQNSKKYILESEEIKLCSFCAFSCYSNRGNANIEELEIHDENDYKCECNSAHHSTTLELIFSININKYNTKYGTNFKTNFQLLNSVLECGAGDDLFVNVYNPIEGGKINLEFTFLIREMANFYKENQNEGLAFFPGEKLTNLFSYNLLEKCLNEFNPSDMKEKLLLYDLIVVLYNIHVLPELSLLKQLRTGDFINSCIIQRLSYRNFIDSDNFYTSKIQKFKKENFIYKTILKLLQTINYENTDFYIIRISLELLRVIEFFIRLLIFSEDELNTIIENLFVLQKQFNNIGLIQNYVNRYNLRDEFGRYILKLSELLFVISVIKNDYRVEKILKNTGDDSNNITFINHYKNSKDIDSDTNQKILQMVIKAQHLTKHFSSQLDRFDEKNILFLLRLGASLFNSSDNLYLKQVDSLKTLQNLKNVFDFRIFKIIKPDPEDAQLIKTNQKFLSCLIKDSSASFSFLHSELSDIILEMDEGLKKKITSNVNKINNTEELSVYEQNIIECKASSLSFVNYLKSLADIEITIDIMMKLSLDNTMSAILFNCLSSKNVPKDDEDFSLMVKLILDMLEVFCLNRRGLIYLLFGKNLTALIKTNLLLNFPIQTLKLILSIFTGIKKYKIDFTDQYFFSELCHTFVEIVNKQMNEWRTIYNTSNIDVSDKNTTKINEGKSNLSKMFMKSIYDSKAVSPKSSNRNMSENLFGRSEINTVNVNMSEFGDGKYSDIDGKQINKIKFENRDVKNFKSPESVILIMKIVNVSSNLMSERDLEGIKHIIKGYILSLGSHEFLNQEVLEEILISAESKDDSEESIKNLEKESEKKSYAHHSLGVTVTDIKREDFATKKSEAKSNEPEMVPIKKNSMIDAAIDFYFEFYKIISKNTYYTNYEEYCQLQNLLNKSLALFMKPNVINLIKDKKKIMLGVLRNLPFSDFIDEKNFQKDFHLTNEELEGLYDSKYILTEDNLEDAAKNFTFIKYKQAKSNIFYIKYITEEINYVAFNIEKYLSEKGKRYITELLLTVKTISDYIFHRQNLVNSYIQPFLDLVKQLISKTDILTEFFNVVFDKTIFNSNSEVLKISNPSFDKIYVVVNNCIENILNENIRKQNFVKILKNYDTHSLIDAGLKEKKRKFGEFYADFSQRYGKNLTFEKKPTNLMVESIENKLVYPLKYFKTSVFFRLLTEREFFSAYIMEDFVNFITEVDHISINLEEFNYYFSFINKIISNSTATVKNKIFDKLGPGYITDEKKSKFFLNLKDILSYALKFSFCANKNYLSPKIKMKIIMANKNILTFLIFLSKNYQEKIIIADSFKLAKSESILEVILDNLTNCLNLLKLNFENDINMPHDPLIIHIDLLVEFIIELIYSTDDNNFDLLNSQILEFFSQNLQIKKLFKNYFEDFSFDFSGKNLTQRNLIIFYVKQKIIKILNTLAQNQYNKMIEPILSSSNLHLELLHSFCNILQVIHSTKNPNLIKKLMQFSNKEFNKYFLELYRGVKEFRNSIQFNYCLTIVEYIKVMKKKFRKERRFKKLMKDNLIKFKKENGISMVNDNSESFINMPEISKRYVMAFRIFNAFNGHITGIQIRTSENIIAPILFFKPEITHFLSNETKEMFESSVERKDPISKLESLLIQSNYFIYEMLFYWEWYSPNYNLSFLVKKSFYETLGFINLLMILTHQALIIYYFYKDVDSSNYDEVISLPKKPELGLGSLILGIIQCIFLFVLICIWFFKRLRLKYVYNLINNFPKKISFKINEEVFNENNKSKDSSEIKSNGKTKEDTAIISRENMYKMKNEDTKFLKVLANVENWNFVNKSLNSVHKSYSFLEKFFTFLYTLIYCSEINIPIATFICVIIFITTGWPFSIVVPSLFLLYFSTTLFELVMVMKKEWKKLVLIILFTWLIIYIFSWISLLWLSPIFRMEDTKDLYVNNIINLNLYLDE